MEVRGREDLAGGNASGASRRDHEVRNQKGRIRVRAKEKRKELGGASEVDGRIRENRKILYRLLKGFYTVRLRLGLREIK